jgi:anti-sigma factor RsiW
MITDYQLHAFVDRQLSGSETGEILAEATRSPELAVRIAGLQQLKALLRHAYAAPSADSSPAKRRRLATQAD